MDTLGIPKDSIQRARTLNCPSGMTTTLCAYLGSDLSSFLWIHHANMFKMLQGVLSVFLFGTDILLQHVEHMTRLQGAKMKKKKEKFRFVQNIGFSKRFGVRRSTNSSPDVKALSVIFFPLFFAILLFKQFSTPLFLGNSLFNWPFFISIRAFSI